MRSRRGCRSSGARGFTSRWCAVSLEPAASTGAPSKPCASAAATAPSFTAPPPPSLVCSTRYSLSLSLPSFLSLVSPHLLSLLKNQRSCGGLGEEVGCGGNGGDVQCPEAAGGGAPSSPPSHRCQSSTPCSRSCSVAAFYSLFLLLGYLCVTAHLLVLYGFFIAKLLLEPFLAFSAFIFDCACCRFASCPSL